MQARTGTVGPLQYYNCLVTTILNPHVRIEGEAILNIQRVLGKDALKVMDGQRLGWRISTYTRMHVYVATHIAGITTPLPH